MFRRWQDLDVDLFCTDCGAPARTTPPTTWNPTWGTPPQFSHNTGQPLCRTHLPNRSHNAALSTQPPPRTLQ